MIQKERFLFEKIIVSSTTFNAGLYIRIVYTNAGA